MRAHRRCRAEPLLGCAEVAVSVGSVPTKFGTYQSNVMAAEGIVSTKVDTHQSGS